MRRRRRNVLAMVVGVTSPAPCSGASTCARPGRQGCRLLFPTELEPVVWGMETSMTAEAFPFRTAISHEQADGRDVFSWSTDDPPLHARYRLEWRFKAREHDQL